MKFDKYKAFPYPVLRPESDDYKEVESAGYPTRTGQNPRAVRVSHPSLRCGPMGRAAQLDVTPNPDPAILAGPREGRFR